METQILNLKAPFDYIYCNGEIGKHIATYIVGEGKVGEDGMYELETHSHPIVQYHHTPRGVVWNRAELTDCEVLCSEDDMRVDPYIFFLLCYQLCEMREKVAESKGEYSPYTPEDEAEPLKEKLGVYGFRFKPYDEPVEVDIEVNTCSEGYFAQVLGPSILNFNVVEATLEDLATRITEERQYWEEFYDHAVKIKFSSESSLAKGFVENL